MPNKYEDLDADWADSAAEPPSPSSLRHVELPTPEIPSAVSSSSPTDSPLSTSSFDFLWYRDKPAVKIGDVNRYIIRYSQEPGTELESIHFRLKNIEKAPIRAIHLLNGPFFLYCHVIPCNYSSTQKLTGENEVVFHNQVQPGRAFKVELKMNKNSLFADENGAKVFQWEVDVVSQIVVSRHSSISYDLMIGSDPALLKKLNTGLRNIDTPEITSTPNLEVLKRDTEHLWNTPPPKPHLPVHLVILTHGIFSNLTADMLYLKDSLESCNDNILVRGYQGNAGRTERGIKTLGTGTGQYILDLIDELTDKKKLTIGKISFIGHSLGGVVQLAAIKYVLMSQGSNYFSSRGIVPYHLVCMASPLLGILSELNVVISWFLDLGTLGKTGRDLTLSKRLVPHLEQNGNGADKKNSFKPVLETLPDEPLQSFLASCKHLTVYANAVNDGIVPLRTSSLLYLDWSALGDVDELEKEVSLEKKVEEEGGEAAVESARKSGETEADLSAFKSKPTNDLSAQEGTGVSSGDTSTYDGHSGNISDVTSVDSVGEVKDDSDEGYFARRTKTPKKIKQEDRTTSAASMGSDPARAKHYKYDLTRKRLTKREKTIARINARASDTSLGSIADTEEEEADVAKGIARSSTFNLPPKASAVESALSTMICPTPSDNYIMDPQVRPRVIFHDKYYHFDNLPPEEASHSTVGYIKQFLFNHTDWRLNKQVKIARKYHTKDLNWRKVLVNLPPDAHNNIIVRRRFANGYGWGVVSHVCRELFSEPEPKI